MTNTSSPMQYLDKAISALHSLGLLPEGKAEEAPIVTVLNAITELDEDRVVAIARTLSQASLFNEVVREQVRAMDVAQRYETIVSAFDSIRDDAKAMVRQIEDGQLDTLERLSNVWMKVTRGDITDRFDQIKGTCLEVTGASRDQVAREQTILNAYQDFRGALKQSEALALEVLKKAEVALEAARAEVQGAMQALEADSGQDPAGAAKPCEALADSEKLAGAARASFLKKCETDTTAFCEARADEKKLAGAARTSSLKKCETEPSAACDGRANDRHLSGAARTSFLKKCESDVTPAH